MSGEQETAKSIDTAKDRLFLHDGSDPATTKAPGEDVTRERKLIDADVQKGVRVLKDILKSSDAEFNSREYLLNKALEFGLSRQPWRQWNRFTEHMNSSPFGLQQLPSEFVDYLRYTAKIGIKTAAEIGVFWGGSSYFSAAVLQRANPGLKYVMIDINDRLKGWRLFSSFLNIEKRVPATSADFVGEKFDLVFIDGDHSYMGAKFDWLNLGRFANKAVAFHDIHGHEYDEKQGGIVRAWNETKDIWMKSHTIVEFAHNPIRWMGIGLAHK